MPGVHKPFEQTLTTFALLTAVTLGGKDCRLVEALSCPVEFKYYSSVRMPMMRTIKFVYWEEDGAWLGYLQDYPDYWTQGETLDDLKDHLRDLYQDLTSGAVPSIRKVDELIVS